MLERLIGTFVGARAIRRCGELSGGGGLAQGRRCRPEPYVRHVGARRATDDDSRKQRKGGDFCAMNCPATLPVSFRLTLSEQRDRLYLPPAADLRLLTGNK